MSPAALALPPVSALTAAPVTPVTTPCTARRSTVVLNRLRTESRKLRANDLPPSNPRMIESVRALPMESRMRLYSSAALRADSNSALRAPPSRVSCAFSRRAAACSR